MDFDLTQGQRRRYEAVREAVAETLAHPAHTSDGGYFTREDWKEAGRLGLLGLCVPEEYGGEGLGVFDTALSLEAFGRAFCDMGIVFAVPSHVLACEVPIASFGTPELKQEMLPRLAGGTWVATNAMTEDDAGSDVSALTTKALRDDGAYVLEGEKSFASNAPDADVVVTYAVTDPHAGFLGITAFAIPTRTHGLEVGPPMQKMGLSCCPAARVTLSGC